MLDGQYFSHWNHQGYGPDHRASLDAGISDAVFENIHTYSLHFDDGRPVPILNWRQRILDGHLGLMASPGHRRNIMDPSHTHVGIGIAYAPEIGEMRLVQEFVNRYVELEPLPARLPVGSDVQISGRLLDGASNPLINVAYKAFPASMSVEQLAETGTYTSAAQFFSAPLTAVDGDHFSTRAVLDHDGLAGLYHVWIFVTVDGQETLAAASIIVVM